MQRISVNYSVSRTVALTEGRADYGTATYQPSDTELQFLCVADRQYLDKHPNETFYLPTSAPSAWPVIADAIKAARLAAEADAEKREAEQAARIEAALAKPDEDWIFRNYHYGAFDQNIPGFSTWLNTPDPVRTESRIVARLAAIRPEIERRNAEAKALREAEAARQAAEQQAKEAVRVAALESLTQWALASEDAALSRAAKDGYEVANAVLRHVAIQLQASVGGEVSTEGTKHWGRWDFEERAAPGAKAFEVYDATKSAVATLDKPEGVLVDLKRISRVKLDPADDDDGMTEYYTAIVVIVKLASGIPCKSRALIVRVDD